MKDTIHTEDSKDTTACGAETARRRVPPVMAKALPPIKMTKNQKNVTCKRCIGIVASRQREVKKP